MSNKIVETITERKTRLRWEERTTDAPHVRERCEYSLRIFDQIVRQISEAIPTIDQLKGMGRGLEVSAQIVGQHRELFKQKFQKEEIDKEECAANIAIVNACVQSVLDAHSKQRDELLKTAGKVDGMLQVAVSTIEQVESYLQNLDSQRRFMADDDAPEAKVEASDAPKPARRRKAKDG